jgi:hypothetical protein
LELQLLIGKLNAANLRYCIFREPDLNNEITAICIEPSDATSRLTSSYPLALKEPRREDIVFHYNRAHNTDQSIPAWIIKHKGQTHYVDHVDVENCAAWSTKETPNNEHTKGSIKFKGKLELQKENDKIIAKIK